MAYRIIESPTGVGEILRACQHLCKVRYLLQHRENNQTKEQEISGEVMVDESERMRVEVLNALGSGEVFTLRLADNRSLQVTFPRGDAFNGVWQVANSSLNGFAPAPH